MNHNHAMKLNQLLLLSCKMNCKTYVMMITMTFSQIAKFANQDRRCRVRICPRMKPKSMKITSATMTVTKFSSPQ